MTFENHVGLLVINRHTPYIDAEITIAYSFNKQDKKIVYEVISVYEFETQYESIKLLEFN